MAMGMAKESPATTHMVIGTKDSRPPTRPLLHQGERVASGRTHIQQGVVVERSAIRKRA